jgi:hypothetical protein
MLALHGLGSLGHFKLINAFVARARRSAPWQRRHARAGKSSKYHLVCGASGNILYFWRDSISMKVEG